MEWRKQIRSGDVEANGRRTIFENFTVFKDESKNCPWGGMTGVWRRRPSGVQRQSLWWVFEELS